MGPLVESLLGWVWLPVLLYGLSLGTGLLVTRFARVELPPALIPPLGFSAALVIIMPGYRLGIGASLGVSLLVAAAAAGFMLRRHDLRALLNPGWMGAAALLAYGLYLAPVVLSGGWTWTGYNFVNDTAIQFQLIDHIAQDGLDKPIGNA